MNARGENMPFEPNIATQITLEGAPILQATANEIARVIKPGGTIELLSPTDYAIGDGKHQLVINAIPGAIVQQTEEIVEGVSLTRTIITVP